MLLNDAPADRESKAGAFFFRTDIRLKDTINTVRIKSRPVVLHGHGDATGFSILIRADDYRSLTASQCILGIDDQIIQNLTKAVGIDLNAPEVGVRLYL